MSKLTLSKETPISWAFASISHLGVALVAALTPADVALDPANGVEALAVLADAAKIISLRRFMAWHVDELSNAQSRTAGVTSPLARPTASARSDILSMNWLFPSCHHSCATATTLASAATHRDVVVAVEHPAVFLPFHRNWARNDVVIEAPGEWGCALRSSRTRRILGVPYRRRCILWAGGRAHAEQAVTLRHPRRGVEAASDVDEAVPRREQHVRPAGGEDGDHIHARVADVEVPRVAVDDHRAVVHGYRQHLQPIHIAATA